MKKNIIFLCGVLIISFSNALFAQNVTITNLEPNEYHSSDTSDINAHGQVVGTFEVSPYNYQGYLWENGQITMIDYLGTIERNSAGAINDLGQITGSSGVPYGRGYQLAGYFREADGTMFKMQQPYCFSYGYGVAKLNNSGIGLGNISCPTYVNKFAIWDHMQVIHFGRFWPSEMGHSLAVDLNEAGDAIINTMVYVRWQGYKTDCYALHQNDYSNLTNIGHLNPDFQQYTKCSDINEAGQIIGHSMINSSTMRCFIWKDGNFTDLSTLSGEYGNCQAGAINNLGQVVGTITTSEGWSRAFLLDSAGFRYLGTLGGTNSSAIDINENGVVIGTSTTDSGEKHAFAYSNGEMVDLGTLGGAESFVKEINDNNQIIGWSLDANEKKRATFWTVSFGPKLPTDIASTVAEFCQSGEIASESCNSINKKLSNAQAALDRGNVKAAINILNATLNEVEAKYAKEISIEAAERLIADIKYLIDLLLTLSDNA